MLGAFVVLGATTTTAFGQDTNSVVKIEQEWEIVLGDPDVETDSPQVVCVISPTGDVASHYAVLEINQQDLPDFSPGGIQLQTWNGEVPLAYQGAFPGEVLSNAQEVVRFTLVMSLHDHHLHFYVKNGDSATWGDFGWENGLGMSVSTSLTNLNQYSSAITSRNSGISFGSNRIQSLKIIRTKSVKANGDVTYDETPVVIHQN